MQPKFKVQRSEAENFSKVWKKNGIHIALQDVHIDFATDFANVVLRSFIDVCKQQAMQATKAAAAEQPKVLVEP